MTGPVLSVRADARLTVPPDSVALPGQLTARADSKAEALRRVAADLEALTADLAALGGVARTAAAERQPLTWSTHSASTWPERDHDPETGRARATGQVLATVSIEVTLRALDSLVALDATLARHESLDLQGAAWLVDADNPAWARARAEAVGAAVQKARDYAAALSSSLLTLEHLADVGLLAGDSGPVYRGTFMSMGARAAGAPAPDAPSLDPVPQELVATVEARFTASEVTLDAL